LHFREDPQMRCNTYLDPDEQVLLPPESLSSLSFSRIPWNTVGRNSPTHVCCSSGLCVDLMKLGPPGDEFVS
jgi:hypothetical protein